MNGRMKSVGRINFIPPTREPDIPEQAITRTQWLGLDAAIFGLNCGFMNSDF
jgi:hypothetical protein